MLDGLLEACLSHFTSLQLVKLTLAGDNFWTSSNVYINEGAGRQHLSGFQSVIIHAQRLSLCIQMYTNRHTLGLLLKSRGKNRVRSNPLVSAVHPSSGLLCAFWKEFYGNVRWLYSTHWTSSLKIAQGHFLKFWQLQNRHPQETVKQGQKSARTGRCWGHDHPEGITNANFSFSYGGRTFLSV